MCVLARSKGKMCVAMLLLAAVLPASLALQPAALGTRRAHELLSDVPLLRVNDGVSAPVTASWNADERAAVFFLRSFG